MKLNPFVTKREVEKLKDGIEEFKKSIQRQLDTLNADLFRLKHPNGEVCYGNMSWFYDGGIYLRYAYSNMIESAIVCRTNYRHLEFIAYKVILKGQHAYVGLQFEHNDKRSDKYFIVDMKDGKSIECDKQEIMSTVEWSVACEGSRD